MSNNRDSKIAPLDSFVPQRGGQDCAIAAIATVIQRPYEEVSAALGIPVDSRSGKADANVLGPGTEMLDFIPPLLRLGWLVTPLVAQEHPHMAGNKRQPKLLTSSQIKDALAGRKAVVGYLDADPAVGEHSLAWNGKQAIDCSNGEIVDLEGVTIHEAVLLTKERPS